MVATEVTRDINATCVISSRALLLSPPVLDTKAHKGISMKITILSVLLSFSTLSVAQATLTDHPSCTSWLNSVSDVMSSAGTQDADGNWTLLCRGGMTKFTFESRADGSYVHTAVYKQATRAAGLRGENLQIGECGWPGREMWASEPSTLTISIACEPGITYTYDSGKSEMRLQTTALSIFSGTNIIRGFYVKRVGNAFSPVGKFYSYR